MTQYTVFPLSPPAPNSVPMTEERKYAILFAATILAARKLLEIEPDKLNMAKGYFVDKAIEDAAFVLERIDKKWPTIESNLTTW